MLHTLRNTIHNAGLTTALTNVEHRLSLLIEVPASVQEDLWQAATALGKPVEWGVSRKDYRLLDSSTEQLSPKVEVRIAPYSYATRLVSEWFKLINMIADSTQVERLFAGKLMPHLSQTAPDDWDKYSRFILLG